MTWWDGKSEPIVLDKEGSEMLRRDLAVIKEELTTMRRNRQMVDMYPFLMAACTKALEYILNPQHNEHKRLNTLDVLQIVINKSKEITNES